MKKGLLAFLVPLLAIGLAGIAGLISVLGMSKLFAGQALIVMVVMGIIESGKVVGASVLHNKWKDVNYKMIRWPLLIMVVIAMGITSLGVYGFFTDAYQKTAGQLSIDQKEIELIENKKAIYQQNIETINGQIDFKNDQAQKLIDLRTQQESRLDSLITNNHWVNVKRTQEQIAEANTDLKVVQADVDTMYMEVSALQDSIGKLDIKILEMESSSEAGAELGPLIYIAEVFNSDMDTVVNYVMLIIMIVFDPFAMVLIVITNMMWKRKEGEKEDRPTPTKLVQPLTEISTPLKEGKTKGNMKDRGDISGRQAPPIKPEPIDNSHDPTLVEEENPEDEIIPMSKYEQKFGPKYKEVYDEVMEEVREEEKPKVGPDKVIETEPKMIREDFKETKGEELDRTWRNILKERKRRKNNNGISRV